MVARERSLTMAVLAFVRARSGTSAAIHLRLPGFSDDDVQGEVERLCAAGYLTCSNPRDASGRMPTGLTPAGRLLLKQGPWFDA